MEEVRVGNAKGVLRWKKRREEIEGREQGREEGVEGVEGVSKLDGRIEGVKGMIEGALSGVVV